MRPKRKNMLKQRALRINQDPEHPLYLFTLTGEELVQIADISRISRDEGGKLIGYQRPEVKRHIQNITEYIDSGNVLFPNSVILALTSDVKFTGSRGPNKADSRHAKAGWLEIPLTAPGDAKPAWIVDGQQRTIALTRSKRRNFPIPVNAFIADNVDTQRDQFLRINSTKPLPRGLIDELLPEVSTVLPANLAARKIPSAVCDMLNRDPQSPFYGLIRQASSRNSKANTAVIADTVVVQMLQESLSSGSGVLFPLRNIATGVTDFNNVRALLFAFWQGVKETFPEAWGLRPERSRLMHGAGIRSVGRLMDRVMASVNYNHRNAVSVVRRELRYVQPHCHWTSGAWDELGDLKWNDVQNISSQIRVLSNFLIRTYLSSRKGGR